MLPLPFTHTFPCKTVNISDNMQKVRLGGPRQLWIGNSIVPWYVLELFWLHTKLSLGKKMSKFFILDICFAKFWHWENICKKWTKNKPKANWKWLFQLRWNLKNLSRGLNLNRRSNSLNSATDYFIFGFLKIFSYIRIKIIKNKIKV